MKRRALLQWLGLAPAVVSLRGAQAKSESGALILTQLGCYQCGECMQPLWFEDIDLKSHPTHAIGVCASWSKDQCSLAGTRYRIPLSYMRVEIEREAHS
jgi:hypothetical protein